MKQCPRCNQTYTDDDLNFCLNDGELLRLAPTGPTSRPYDDPPPTVIMGDARSTNPTGFPAAASTPAWQPGPVQAYQPQSFNPYLTASPSTTLPFISLGLGVASIVVGWCCSLGLILSPAAIIVGIVALFQISSNPKSYGGKGFAIAGIAIGAAGLAVYVLILAFAIIGNGIH